MTTKLPFLVRSARSSISIEGLAHARPEALQRVYWELFGCAVPAGNSEHARRKIAWQVQAEKEGGLPESARQHALAIARSATGQPRGNRSRPDGQPAVSSRLPSQQDSRGPMPGSVLIKDYKGKRITVRVLVSGFEWDEKHFTSLSAVAREITGTKWNGLLFFGLSKGNAHGHQA